jgi:hypothetical protein
MAFSNYTNSPTGGSFARSSQTLAGIGAQLYHQLGK